MSQSLEQGKRKLTAKDAITAGALGAVSAPMYGLLPTLLMPF